mgnify:CR=1 FL=1
MQPEVVELLVEIQVMPLLEDSEHEAHEHENAARDAGNDDIMQAFVERGGGVARRDECHERERKGGGEKPR